jgi:hypothetical protein
VSATASSVALPPGPGPLEIQLAGAYSESLVAVTSYAVFGFVLPATSLPAKLSSTCSGYPVTGIEWPLSSCTRRLTCAVACGSWKASTEPSAATGESARSRPAWLAISRTPTKSGVEVTAARSAVIVVRVLPSALGRFDSRNLLASAASVLGNGAPLTHLLVPAADAVPRSQW